MVKIVTIHGTNAGDPSSRGDQWWQLGSDFQQKLEARLAARGVRGVRFEPFHWSGDNSELDRRRAGARLADRLEDEDAPAIVIGHSHGGSVALHALFNLTVSDPKKAFDHIRTLITVGTPMIRYRAVLNPIFRFNIIGQLFLIYALLIGSFAFASIFFSDAVDDVSGLVGQSLIAPFIDADNRILFAISQVFTPAVILACVLPIFILTMYARRTARRNRTFASNALVKQFESIYAPVNHAMDEAIAALRTGVGLRMRIVDRPTVRAALLAPLALFFAAILTTRTVSERVDLQELSAFLLDDYENAAVAPTVVGEAPIGIRDAASRFAELKGQLRDSSTEKPALLRQMVLFARDDYVVLDLATAIRTRHRDSLIALLEGIGPRAVSRIVNGGEEFGCTRDAIYLTEAGRQRLIEAARALPAREYEPDGDGPVPVRSARKRAYSDDAVGRALEAQAVRCEAADVAFLGQGSAIEELLAAGVMYYLAGDALYSSQPEISELLTVATEVGGPLKDARFARAGSLLVYPEITSGEAVVFERSTHNDAFVACLAANAWTVLRPVTARFGDAPGLLRSLDGFCDQFEGGYFTLYDFSTTFLGEIENILHFGVGLVAGVVDRFISDTAGDDADIVNITDYLGDQQVRAGVLSPVIFVFSVLSVAFLSAWALSFILAPVLSGIFNNLIKKSIFGNDGAGEIVKQVAPGLDFRAKQIGTLPEAVERDITHYVGTFAPQTIERLREIISLSALAEDGAMPLPEIAQNLTWKELIHTAYFDVDSFVDHVADLIVKKGGFA